MSKFLYERKKGINYKKIPAIFKIKINKSRNENVMYYLVFLEECKL